MENIPRPHVENQCALSLDRCPLTKGGKYTAPQCGLIVRAEEHTTLATLAREKRRRKKPGISQSGVGER